MRAKGNERGCEIIYVHVLCRAVHNHFRFLFPYLFPGAWRLGFKILFTDTPVPDAYGVLKFDDFQDKPIYVIYCSRLKLFCKVRELGYADKERLRRV